MGKKKIHLGKASYLATEGMPIPSLFCLFNTCDASFVARALLQRDSEFEEFTKSNLSPEELIDFLKTLVHIYNLKETCLRSPLLAKTHSEEFINNIKKILIHNANNVCSKEAILFMYFVDGNIDELPISAVYYNRFYSLLEILVDSQPCDKFSDWACELIVLLKKKMIHTERTKYSWKELNVHPCEVDLFDKKELMANKVNEAYDNTQEYLDTIFKLLKEDYELSLREGILQMKAEHRGAKEDADKEICVYNNVTIERVNPDRNPMNGVIYKIAFSVGNSGDQFVNIDKTFKHGSLILLSQFNQFRNFVRATIVEDVGVKESENGTTKILKISLVDNDKTKRIKPYWQYFMIESKVFSKPYCEVLTAIQSKSIKNFPMEKYIVYLDKTLDSPKYISADMKYKFDGKSIKLFGNDPWPKNLLNLDRSQLEALKSALTNEFVLIQGPPGSGKTHLAQTIIDVLIDNKSFLSTPILVISVNNYQVDFILESLVLKNRKVLRLGKQTKSDILKNHLLNNSVITCDRDRKIKIEKIKESLRQRIDQGGSIESLVECLKEEQSSYRDLRGKDTAHHILSAKVDVIGGTTAGCASLNHLLEKVRPEVVIVENANEAVDGHIIAALSQGCKHLILVGDYKQLQPNISNRYLKDYNLNVSLFERMIKGGVKHCLLREQHRMRPEIASLLSPQYKQMANHSSVHNLPKIRGMEQNLFFIDHGYAENKDSFSNNHEGDFLLCLASYLLFQGYSPEEITILVPYSEQLKYMTSAAKNYHPLLKDVGIFTIDIYPGRENTVILLSLVRSHSDGIGFLSNNNRIVVALSRAKCGLYIIGNMKTLTSDNNSLWPSVRRVLKKKNAIGNSINLQCETHKTKTVVSKKEDFNLSARGGCHLQCNLPLDCGHICYLNCHPLKEKHATLICSKPCLRFCKQNLHKCKKKCYEDCGKCDEYVEVTLPCGHSSKKKCANEINEICTQPIVVSYLCCLRKVVPCWQSKSCFYRKV